MGSHSTAAEHNGKSFNSGSSVEVKSESSPIQQLQPPATNSSVYDVPDGGTLAWLQVLASFFVLMNTWGIINTFGAYQTFYEVDLLRSHSPSAISWIGSIQGCLLSIVGALTGPISDAGHTRALLLAGSFLVVLGTVMTSLVEQYYQAFLAQGVCFGIGAGMLFVPSVAVVSTYFEKHRSFAVGVLASGSSLGGVIYPAIFHQLQPKIGFGWATRVIALAALVTLTITNLATRQRVLPTMRRKLFDVSALHEAPFVLCTMGIFFGFVGLYIPFFFITPYALAKTGANSTLAFYFVPILNAASVFGRIAPNALADRIGTLNTLVPCAFFCAVLAFAWIAVESTGGLIVFAIFYGFFSGSFVALPPSTITALSKDLRKVGTRLGMSFAVGGLGVLIGSPVGGALLNLKTGEFVHAQVFCAVAMMISCVSLAMARVAKSGFAIMIKS
ncbi:MFS general substrate transporter [Multifurca ochricompacta]|uniref:MFS general substrate transporter n=1 Tax=Multifurca ochricompacta TaxID=376703 RepID=A0AAD4QJU0_9AGAM|nr:MFS general substrate transporter [Multifurca ochricompacta]